MGAEAETVTSIAALEEAFLRAKAGQAHLCDLMQVDAFEGWTTEGHAWWEVGTPEVSTRPDVTAVS